MNWNLFVLLCTSQLMFVFTCVYIEPTKKLKEQKSFVYVRCSLHASILMSLVCIFFRIMTKISTNSCLYFGLQVTQKCQIRVILEDQEANGGTFLKSHFGGDSLRSLGILGFADALPQSQFGQKWREAYRILDLLVRC